MTAGRPLDRPQAVDGASPARAIAALAVGLLLLAGCSSHRAPERWQAVVVPTDAQFDGLWFSDSLNGWVTGGGWAVEGGIVGRTRDGGRTWRFESGIMPGGGDRSSLARVQFRDSLRGCATASHGRILLTDDGGRGWRAAAGTSGDTHFALDFVDAWNGWAAGSAIARTRDGGETWRTLTRGTAGNGYLSANAIHFVDESRGWLAGHGGALLRTEDGGTNWTPVTLPLRAGERPTLWDVTFRGDTHGWVAGEHGTIFHTDDGGATWSRQETGVPIVRVVRRGEPPRPREVLPELETEPDQLTIKAIRFADALRGWAVGWYADVAESVVLHTADGGSTGEVEHVQPGELLRTLFVLDAGRAWAAGDRARTRPQVVLRYAPGPR